MTRRRPLVTAILATFVVSAHAHAGDPDSLWFGGIDENGLATQGGIWDFEDGTLQGWTSTDLTDEGTWFRHVTIDSCNAHAADGCPVISEGSSTGSMWLGAFEDEARPGCWPGGQGYGNLWYQEFHRTFAYSGEGEVTITFDYFVDSETQWDFSYLYVDVAGERSDPLNTSDWTTPEGWGYSGAAEDGLGIGTPTDPAHDTIVLGPDVLPPGTEAFTLAFTFESGYLYSDALDGFPGFLNTWYGPFGVDDVHVVGGGLDDLSDFEPTGIPGEELDGWTATSVPPIGTYLQAVPLADLDPPDVTGACPIEGTVMIAAVLDGSDYPHPDDQRERLVSNPVHVGPGSPAHASGLDRWLVRWDVYEDLPNSLGVAYRPRVHYYPWTCPETGVVGWTLEPAGDQGFIFADPPRCRTAIADLSAQVPDDVDSLRIAIALVGDCDDWGTKCLGADRTNPSPYLDPLQIGLTGVIGVDDADEAPTAGGTGILAVHPNPIRTGTTLVDTPLDPGVHTVRWDVGTSETNAVAPGVYWVRLRAGDRPAPTLRTVVTGR